MIKVNFSEDAPIAVKFVEAAIKPEQEKTVTPAETAQTVLPDDGYTLSRVNVEAVPWVKPEGEITLTENGDHDVEAYQTATVAVPAPSGEITITQNGQHDVADYESADVQVPQGVFPSGTLEISESGTYDVTEYESAKVSITPSLTPILIDTIEITEPLAAGARYTIPLTSYDYSGYHVVWIELINFTLSVQDWLYMDFPWSQYFGVNGTNQKVYNLKKVLLVSLNGGVEWRRMTGQTGLPGNGDITGVADVKLYPYYNTTSIQSGTIKIWAY